MRAPTTRGVEARSKDGETTASQKQSTKTKNFLTVNESNCFFLPPAVGLSDSTK